MSDRLSKLAQEAAEWDAGPVDAGKWVTEPDAVPVRMSLRSIAPASIGWSTRSSTELSHRSTRGSSASASARS